MHIQTPIVNVDPTGGVVVTVGTTPVQLFATLVGAQDSIFMTQCDGEGFVFYDFSSAVSPLNHFDYLRPWEGPTFVQHQDGGDGVWIVADREGQTVKAYANGRAIVVAPPEV